MKNPLWHKEAHGYSEFNQHGARLRGAQYGTHRLDCFA